MDVATLPADRTIGVRALKNHLSAVLERVKHGEDITITEHGRPIARLTTVSGDVDHMHELVARGIVRPAAAPRRLPTRRVRATAADLAEDVSDQRR